MGEEGCCMGRTRVGEVGSTFVIEVVWSNVVAGVSGVVVMPECCHGFIGLELMRWLG
jgi:hypothetical protein